MFNDAEWANEEEVANGRKVPNSTDGQDVYCLCAADDNWDEWKGDDEGPHVDDPEFNVRVDINLNVYYEVLIFDGYCRAC